MHLAHLITGQAILISTVLTIFVLSEEAKFTHLLNRISRMPTVRIADEKGVILLLLSLASALVFTLDFLASQASLCRSKLIRRRLRSAKALLVQNMLLFLLTFISAYIFRSISPRTYNLSGLSFLFLLANTLGRAAGVRTVATWGYFGFIFCSAVINLHTFFGKAELYYTVLSRLVLRLRVF